MVITCTSGNCTGTLVYRSPNAFWCPLTLNLSVVMVQSKNFDRVKMSVKLESLMFLPQAPELWLSPVPLEIAQGP